MFKKSKYFKGQNYIKHNLKMPGLEGHKSGDSGETLKIGFLSKSQQHRSIVL